jgi:hypothetical protein
MSIVPLSRLSLDECSQLGNNTIAAALRDRLSQHRQIEGPHLPRRRWRFRPAPKRRRGL